MGRLISVILDGRIRRAGFIGFGRLERQDLTGESRESREERDKFRCAHVFGKPPSFLSMHWDHEPGCRVSPFQGSTHPFGLLPGAPLRSTPGYHITGFQPWNYGLGRAFLWRGA